MQVLGRETRGQNESEMGGRTVVRKKAIVRTISRSSSSVGLGFVIPMMFLLGVIFAALWSGAYFLGRKVDIERAQRAALEEEWAAEHPDA
jgi:hypothetical protein